MKISCRGSVTTTLSPRRVLHRFGPPSLESVLTIQWPNSPLQFPSVKCLPGEVREWAGKGGSRRQRYTYFTRGILVVNLDISPVNYTGE